MIKAERKRIVWRLLLIVIALNVAGIACFSLTTRAHDPLTMRSFASVADSSSLLDSLGFMLMLPGIFFAAVAFLCARVFAWSDGAARAIWYGTAFATNLAVVCRASRLTGRQK